MSDPNVWSQSIPFIQDGDPVSAQTANAPTQVLSDRTAALKVMLDAIEAGEQLSLRNAPLSSGVSEGNVVYFKADTLNHDLAVAQWKDLQTTDAKLAPADSAVYTGIVTVKHSENVGDILINGVLQISEAAEAVLFNGETPEVGEYYLSMLTGGIVEQSMPAMSVRTLQYMGDRIIRVFPPQHEPITHSHKSYDLLISDWVDTTNAPPGSVIPPGASYWYDLNSASALEQGVAESLLPNMGEPIFIDPGSGTYFPPSTVEYNSDGYWLLDAAPYDVLTRNTQADAKGIALVHSIYSSFPEAIEVINNNGCVSLNFLPYVVTTTEAAGHVVVKELIDDPEAEEGMQHIVKKGPIVEKIVAGRGITMSSTAPNGQGTVTLGSALLEDQLIESSTQNLNNTATVAAEETVYTLFPRGRTSSVSCRVMLPNLGGASYNVSIFAQFLSPPSGGAQAPPSISGSIMPNPSADGVTPVPFLSEASFPDFPSSTTSGDVYLLETGLIILSDLQGISSGSVSYTLFYDEDVDEEIKLLYTGIRVSLN